MRGRFVLAAVTLLALECDSTQEAHVVPPPPPDDGTAAQETMTFAIDRVWFGESLNGQIDTSAWKTLGYDLDGKITSKDSLDVCTLVEGAPKFIQSDGEGGIDNSFAANVMPIIVTGLSPAKGPDVVVTDVETSAIQAGRFTLQIQIEGLDEDPNQTAIGLRASTFVSDALDAAPAFDMTTDWPVLDQAVEDGKTIASGAVVRFDDAYVTNGTFVAGMSSRVTVPFRFVVNDIPITLPIHSAIITFQHADARSGTQGILAGVLDVTELQQAIAGFVHVNNGTAFCGAEFGGIADQLAQQADIFVDRYNAPGIPCSGISLAIGFHAERVANPTTVVSTPRPPPDSCLDAGTD